MIPRPYCGSEMARALLVTSVLPTTGDDLRLADILPAIQADIFVRFQRLLGRPVLFLCGDDTHRSAATSRDAAGSFPPDELFDGPAPGLMTELEAFSIDFSHVSSALSDQNRGTSTQLFNLLLDKGYIYEKDVRAAYCTSCRRVLPDHLQVGQCPRCGAADQTGLLCSRCNGLFTPEERSGIRCGVCGAEPAGRPSRHYFFRLCEFAGRMNSWLADETRFQPQVHNTLTSWLHGGLFDWRISRDGPSIGIPIPGELNKFFHVWLEAAVGYLVGTRAVCDGSGQAHQQYWCDGAGDIVHFSGEHGMFFHALLWPAILMGADYDLPKRIVIQGNLKTIGRSVNGCRASTMTPKVFRERLDPEHLRYFLAGRLGPDLHDVELSPDGFMEQVNGGLIETIAGFCDQCLQMTGEWCDGRVGMIPSDSDALVGRLRELYTRVGQAYAAVNFQEVITLLGTLAGMGGALISENLTGSTGGNADSRARSVLSLCVNMARNLAILIKPVLPRLASDIETQLGLVTPQGWDDLNFDFTNRTLAGSGLRLTPVDESSAGIFGA